MPNSKGAQHASNIMGALTEAPRAMSAYDLLDRLRPTGVVAPLTVYRALDKLIKSGKVHRIESLNAFVACRDGEHCHEGDEGFRAVGFAICDDCGAVQEFVDVAMSGLIATCAAAKAFRPRSSAVEVHGLCGACQDKSAPT